MPGQDFLVAGRHHRADHARTPTDNLYLQHRRRSRAAPANQFGNAPRTLPGVLSPWRNNVDLSVEQERRAPAARTSLSVRMEVLNLFNMVQWAAPASAAFGNSSFGQITQPGEQHAHGAVHVPVPVLTTARTFRRVPVPAGTPPVLTPYATLDSAPAGFTAIARTRVVVTR